MSPLLLAASLLAAAPARAADARAADWRRAGLSDAMKEALRGERLRLEDDGRVRDAGTNLALTRDQLFEMISRIKFGTQRLALERLDLILSRGSLGPAGRAAAEALKPNLPEDVARSLDEYASLGKLRRTTAAGMSRIADYFDGARSFPGRVRPSWANAPRSYSDESGSALGRRLRGAVVKRLAADPVGRRVLARLAGADGKPALPPIVVEDASDPAQYDYRRRVLIVDGAAALASVTSGVPPKDRAALATMISAPPALTAYLNVHPEAVASLIASNDALLVHELMHAWQDRRDPVMREMARGGLPLALIVDYEVEAWTTKNLYIASRLKNSPGVPVDINELRDYRRMLEDPARWAVELRRRYAAAAPNAMDLDDLQEMQRRRIAFIRERTARAANVRAMTRARRTLEASAAAISTRLAALAAEAGRAAKSAEGPLAEHYLALALDAPRRVDCSALIETAERYAGRSGDAELLGKVRSHKGCPR